jgi:TetR/AcrR family transcriptional repressor of mexJK operon
MTKAIASRPKNSPDTPPPDSAVRRRGRPRLSEVAVLHERIVETAKALFYERGFADTTMDAVAVRTGISKGTLYSRFANKAELFIAVFENQIHQWWTRANVENAPAADGDLVAFLKYRANRILEAMLSPEFIALRQVLDAARPQFPDLARSFFEVGVGHGVVELAAEIKAAEAVRGVVCRDALGAASSFISLLAGWSHEKIVTGQADKVTKIERSAWADRAVELFTTGRAAW